MFTLHNLALRQMVAKSWTGDSEGHRAAALKRAGATLDKPEEYGQHWKAYHDSLPKEERAARDVNIGDVVHFQSSAKVITRKQMNRGDWDKVALYSGSDMTCLGRMAVLKVTPREFFKTNSKVAKQYGDMVEDAEAARLRANAQARGEVEPDLGKDLPKYVSGQYQAALGAADLIHRFHPHSDDRREPPGADQPLAEPPASVLANCDGVSVPKASKVWKNVFTWV